MLGSSEHFEIGNLISQGERAVAQSNFSNIYNQMGIDSALITYIPFAFGKPGNGKVLPPYRQFFYNDSGNVVKKFDFDAAGAIAAKEAYVFEKIKGWERIVSSRIITDDDITEEEYKYNDKGQQTHYILKNRKWPAEKVEIYEYDEFDRKQLKTSKGFINEPYLITHYLYDTKSAKDRKPTYRHVTLPDGSLVLTILWTYDAKKDKQIGMYTFLMTPEEITDLRAKNKNWEHYSFSWSRWGYDTKGNHTGFEKDVLLSGEFDSIFRGKGKQKPNRLVTEKYTNEYQVFPNGKNYLVRTTEWLTNMDEPLKAIKEYQYFDKEGKDVLNGIIQKVN